VLALRLARFGHLIDLNRIPALRYVAVADGVTRIGAMTTQAVIAGSQEVLSRVPLLARATAHIGHFQIRNRGTIGGSLSHADPGAEYPAVAITLDAEIVLASTRGTRTVTATEFFTGTFSTTAEPDEILTEVRFASRPPGAAVVGPLGCAVVELARRHGDFALAGVACAVELDSAELHRAELHGAGLHGAGRIRSLRLGLFGVASAPVRAVAAEQAARGAAAAEVDPEALGRAALSGVSCVSDLHADAGYRKRVAAHLVGQAVRRALQEARDG
jgi:carbon-monoxide dehydrogenase medium subunit